MEVVEKADVGGSRIENPETVLVVSGPTASGKTSFSLRLCELIGGEVVNVDSVQLYRELDIGSAKPSHAEMQQVPHHCFDIVSPHKAVDAAEFAGEVLKAIRSIRERGKVPVLVGSPGMYLSFLFNRVHHLPKADTAFRESVADEDVARLYEQLGLADPERAAQLKPNDRSRIVRALECFHVSGRKQSSFFKEEPAPALCRALFLVRAPERTALYERINRRSQKMVDVGLLEETSQVISKYGKDIRSLGALGYKQAVKHLEGTLSREELVAEIALHTRRYAKRQTTFWRNEPRKQKWLQWASFLSCDQTLLESRWLDTLLNSFNGIETGRSPQQVWYLRSLS